MLRYSNIPCNMCRNGFARQVTARLQRVTSRAGARLATFFGLTATVQSRACFYFHNGFLNCRLQSESTPFLNMCAALARDFVFPTWQDKFQRKWRRVTPPASVSSKTNFRKKSYSEFVNEVFLSSVSSEFLKCLYSLGTGIKKPEALHIFRCNNRSISEPPIVQHKFSKLIMWLRFLEAHLFTVV